MWARRRARRRVLQFERWLCKKNFMTPQQLHVFTEEVMIHILVAQRDFSQLMSLVSDPEQKQKREVWVVLQAFLVHVGMVSKFFFPATKDKVSNQRALALRKHLQVVEDSELAGRAARNAFEHLDERMDNWLRTEGRGILESVYEDEADLNYLVPERWAVRRALILEPLQFVSEEKDGRLLIPLMPLVEALDSLKTNCANRLANYDPHNYASH